MATHYRETLADVLKAYDNNQHSYQFYMDLAWEGLAQFKDLNNDSELIYSEAWKELSSSEQQQILYIISNEKQNGSKECN
jgi:hypothetical protein